MNLETTYMGLKLKSPILPSASPLTYNLDNIKALEDAGVGAIVCHSLFEEQIMHESGELDHYLSYGTESFAEATSYFPEPDAFVSSTDEYIELISKIKSSVEIPVIGSLNGVSAGGWVKYAKNIQEAGADAIELNIYFIPTNPNITGAEIVNMYVDILKAVKENVSIPVAMKLSPFFTSMANVAREFDRAGADALVLFNRFYQPDFDLEKLEVVPNLVLSTSWEMRLPLRWIAILYGHINASLAITRGVHSHLDVLKAMMAGSDVAMICSEILLNGIGRLKEIKDGVIQWMEEHEYDSIETMKGSMSQKSVDEPAAFERANYMKVLQSYKTLI